MTVAQLPEYGDYICVECAVKAGGVWPKGHEATQFSAECDMCGEVRTLCSAGDWDWPDGKSHGMRD